MGRATWRLRLRRNHAGQCVTIAVALTPVFDGRRRHGLSMVTKSLSVCNLYGTLHAEEVWC